MTKIALLAILLLMKLDPLCQLVSAGKPPSKPPSKAVVARQERRDDQNRLCIYKKRFSLQQIANLFPFNKAKKIQLVSYEYNWNKSPFYNKKIDSSQFKETIVIRKGQIDSLTDVLYNIPGGALLVAQLKFIVTCPEMPSCFLTQQQSLLLISKSALVARNMR